jgi:hypothetical protein
MKARGCLFQETKLRREFGRCWWVGINQSMVAVMTFHLLDEPLPIYYIVY